MIESIEQIFRSKNGSRDCLFATSLRPARVQRPEPVMLSNAVPALTLYPTGR